MPGGSMHSRQFGSDKTGKFRGTRHNVETVHHTVDWTKLEIVLYTLFVLVCPTKLTGLDRTGSTFVPCSS